MTELSAASPTTQGADVSIPAQPGIGPVVQGEKLRGKDKLARIPVKIIPTDTLLRKPDWIRVKVPAGNKIAEIKAHLREQKLHTVCEEASCPNLPECFGKGTATFMIMGDICTRRCPFCDVAHGRPNALDPNEPQHLAESVAKLQLKHVVVTSVDRDDLRDGGGGHFRDCIAAIRASSPHTRLEVLVPDFRGRIEPALEALRLTPPDIFNHNLESIPRLYKAVRPGSDYAWSLILLKRFKAEHPTVLTKSGLMLGLGETIEEVIEVMRDLRAHDVDMLTLGQYLQPSRDHLAIVRYVHPDEFKQLADIGATMGFKHVASGPMVRSSYHAEEQVAHLFT